MMNFSVSLVNNWWFDESRIRAFDEWDEVALYLNVNIFLYLFLFYFFIWSQSFAYKYIGISCQAVS